MPEVAEVWVVDACAGADNVDAAEFLGAHGEHVGELGPGCHICFEEYGAGVRGGF